MIDMMEDLLTVEEVAKKLNVAEETVKRLLRTNQLSGYKVNRQWRISPNDLANYLAKQKNIQQ